MLEIDLHGVKHGDVRSTLIRFIEDHRKADIDFEVVTGHSEKMKEIVKEILDEYDLKYYDGGYLGVRPAIIRVEMDL